jgi:hypothetical protein
MSNTLRSKIAERHRDVPCTLNGKPAKIMGWKLDFATVGTLDGTLAYEWAWETVDRIMSNGGNFKG